MVGAAAGGAVAGILIGRNINATQKGIEAATESWKALESEGYSFALEEVSGLKTPTGKHRPALTTERAGAKIEVRIKTDIVHFGWTEIVAHRATPFDGKIGVHLSPGGVRAYLRSLIGQDIEIGDEAFDSAYLITGKPETAPASLLVPSIRELIATIGERLTAFTCEDSEVKIQLMGVISDVAVIRLAVDLAAAGASWTG